MISPLGGLEELWVSSAQQEVTFMFPPAHQCHVIRPLPWLAFGNGLESPRCSRDQVFPMGLFQSERGGKWKEMEEK